MDNTRIIDPERLLKILLVDDSPPVRYLTRRALAERKLTGIIFEATDGKEALDYILLTEHMPDIILLDVNMPLMDGLEFLQEYKKLGLHKAHTRIYVLTTTITDGIRDKILNTGIVTNYFEKPLDIEAIDVIMADLQLKHHN